MIGRSQVAIRDAEMMQRTLELARGVLGAAWPNPAVGCVIVQGDIIVGEGATQPGGRPHAETVALEMAGDNARGATVYVSLEPCSHWGQTSPCAESLIEAGVQRVVVATKDPDPRVNGRGVEMLLAAGIAVDLGVCEKEARQVNAGFFHRVRRGVPLVTALDPDLDTASSLYRSLGAFDAVVVSLDSFRPQDYPDVRFWIVVDDPQVSPQAFFQTAGHDTLPACLVVAEGRSPSRTDLLARAFSGVLAVPAGEGQIIDFGVLLQMLGEQGLTHVAVDGPFVAVRYGSTED